MTSNNGKTALITGASSGIGYALATAFAQGGYNVILAARSISKMQELADNLQRQFGISATVIAADLQTDTGATQLHAQIKARGITLAALVNNAGLGTFGEFHKSELPDELAMMQLNMSAVVALTRLFLPDLLATQGKILNVASTAAFQPVPYMAVYAATKAFVRNFSEAIAAELEGTGVTVTALCPGATVSGFFEKAEMHNSGLVKGKKLPSSQEVARAGYAAMQRGQRVYIPGVMNWLLAQGARTTPRNLMTRIVKSMMKPT